MYPFLIVIPVVPGYGHLNESHIVKVGAYLIPFPRPGAYTEGISRPQLSNDIGVHERGLLR